ncbi:MAG: hypothetical protein JOZ77_11720 [Candidatus Eremiobacteraeota bacterium]|nr:hypothetical protein [Candidatus Eremiobacteraeota bacterium]
MPENAAALLTPWSSFYVMTGSAAAGLTGLMFVVISLVTGWERGANRDGISTFSTPTVMHFGAALLVSAILVAPWHSLVIAGVCVALVGLLGVIYVVRVTYRARRLRTYTPDFEDWTWYNVLPFLAYGALLGGAIALAIAPAQALFAIACGAIVLIFIGIRNAWDIVTYLAVADSPTSSK